MAVASHHAAPVDALLLAEIIAGLSQPQKQLSPKLFYDERGSRLFERIGEQPEYYLPRVETALLREHADDLRRFAGPRCVVMEPGAGYGGKTPLLLRALDEPVAYVPVELDDTALARCRQHIASVMPRLPLFPLRADFTRPFAAPRIEGAQWRRRILFFPGSTIGNFDPAEARRLLADWRNLAGARGGLIIGVDLRKSPQTLEEAYNDAAGVTAQFNLNVLERLNRDFGASFDVASFRHRAIFNEEQSRIEMHLVSQRPQRVSLGGRRFMFATGETVHTENSYKYTPADFAEIALAAGWVRRELWIDRQDLFSVQCYDAIA